MKASLFIANPGFHFTIRSVMVFPKTHSPPTPSFSYKRHQPEKTLLHKLIQENLLTFYQQMNRDYENGLPEFVKREFDGFLKCRVLANGFLRVQCTSCNHEKLVAFSCKKRGFCLSCGVGKMAETATYLTDKVFPKKPMRQWVLTFPFQLRLRPQGYGRDFRACQQNPVCLSHQKSMAD